MTKTAILAKFRSLLPYFLLALLIIVAYKVINELSYFTGIVSRIWGIVTPFFYGFLLAYIINIPCGGIRKLLTKTKIKFIVKRQKVLSIIIVFIIFALIFSLILNLIIPAISTSISFFIANFPHYYDMTLEYVEYINSLDIPGVNISLDLIIKLIQDLMAHFSLENLVTSVNALVSVSSAIFSGFLALISSIYILMEKEKFKAFLSRVLKAFTSNGAYSFVMEYTGRLNRNFKQYIYTQTIDGLILGTIVTIELYILRSPFALLLGIMLGIVNYIPYFGSIIGSLIAIIIVSFTQGLATGAITAVVLLITQQIDGNIIQPRLMGGSFSLSPFLVIVSITVGGALAGVLGMIAAIPIVAVLKDIFELVVVLCEGKKNGGGNGANGLPVQDIPEG